MCRERIVGIWVEQIDSLTSVRHGNDLVASLFGMVPRVLTNSTLADKFSFKFLEGWRFEVYVCLK